MKEVTDEKLDKYFALTKEALAKVKIPENLNGKDKNIAEDFLQMAKSYYSDAKHFREKGDYPTALAAASYAHAWLDAGARQGIFDVDHDSRLFTVD